MELPERRYGKFSVEGDVAMTAPDIVRKVMGECVILRCEHIFQTNTFEYEAWCPSFESVPQGMIPPTYDVVYDSDTETVTWAKQEG